MVGHIYVQKISKYYKILTHLIVHHVKRSLVNIMALVCVFLLSHVCLLLVSVGVAAFFAAS